MRKGMGRSAALLAMSSAATVILSVGPGLTAAHADIFDDKGRCDDKKSEEWDIFGDKDRDDKDHRGDKEARAFVDDRNDRDKDDRDKDDRDKDGRDKDDWFNDKDRDCPVGVVAGVGVGVGAGGAAPAGGVGAGGGGTADSGNSPLLPIAGAGLGAILIGAGMRRRGHGSI